MIHSAKTITAKFLSSKTLPSLQHVGSVRALSPAPSEPENASHADTTLTSEGPSGTRRNAFGITMLPLAMHRQVFGEQSAKEISAKTKADCIDEFKRHKMADKLGIGHRGEQELSFKLPPAAGATMDEHFRRLAAEQTRFYTMSMEKLLADGLPPTPTLWNYEAGWTKYSRDGSFERVACPAEDAYIFDVEICCTDGRLPTLATAASGAHWYSWCSSRLVDDTPPVDMPHVTEHQLIPLEDGNPAMATRLVIGHNVPFDRALTAEQYRIAATPTRFLDTMSMHIALAGFATPQRNLFLSYRSLVQGRPKSTTAPKTSPRKSSRISQFANWHLAGSLNNLVDVHALHCGGDAVDTVDKALRDVFVNGSLFDIRENFNTLCSYCAGDVRATFEVARVLWPQFQAASPHPVSLAGMLEMSIPILPVNHHWCKYIERSNAAFADIDRDVRASLKALADEALLLDDDEVRQDVWLWNLEWKKGNARTRRGADKPLWYRKLLTAGSLNEIDVSLRKRVVPKLLRLSWDGWPLHYDAEKGWGYLELDEDYSTRRNPTDSAQCQFPLSSLRTLRAAAKPTTTMSMNDRGDDDLYDLEGVVNDDINAAEQDTQKGTGYSDVIPGCIFYRLPHKDGIGTNVGNPLSQSFLGHFESGRLRGVGADGSTTAVDKLVRLSKKMSQWLMYQKRVQDQLVVRLSSATTTPTDEDEEHWCGAIVPRIVPAGTVTRRAVEQTWLTAMNPKGDRIGSELKAMVQVPDASEYCFVGADVDSQELWIASLLGDAHAGRTHGCTPLGWMTLDGDRRDGTDLHSRVAALVGTTRDQAKVLNYARMYGAGQPFLAVLIAKFNPELTKRQAIFRSNKLMKSTKGQRMCKLNRFGAAVLLPLLDDDIEQTSRRGKVIRTPTGVWLTRDELIRLHKMTNDHSTADGDQSSYGASDYRSMVAQWSWQGGTESAMFRALESIARSDEPRTPVLGVSITRCLQRDNLGASGGDSDAFLTSRINWVVQSSAVDYLHLLLVAVRHLFQFYGVNGRYVVSIHDEVRYMVKRRDRYRAALALQVANLWTRALFAERVGIADLPASVAFFTSVEIDACIRKDPLDDCVTPSNPAGLAAECGIGPGESLTIDDVLKSVRDEGMVVNL